MIYCIIFVDANMLFIGDRDVDVFINVTCSLPSLAVTISYNYIERFPFIVRSFP